MSTDFLGYSQHQKKGFRKSLMAGFVELSFCKNRSVCLMSTNPLLKEYTKQEIQKATVLVDDGWFCRAVSPKKKRR
jgi:hypothetical protein